MKKNKLGFIYVILFVLGVICTLSGEEKITQLTLQECLLIAEERNEELKIQADRIKQASYRLNQSRSTLRPVIKLKSSLFFRDTVQGDYSGSGVDPQLTLSQPLFYGFRKTAAVSLAQTERKKEEYQSRIVYRTLKLEITLLFYSIVQIDSDINNIQNTLNLMRDRVKELKERVRLGKSRESELLAVESQIATFQAQQEKSQSDREKIVESLARLIGRDSSLFAVKDDKPVIEEAGQLNNYLEAAKSRPEIISAQQDTIIQTSKIKIAKGALLPTLNLDSSFSINPSQNLSGSKWYTAFSLDLPLYQGGFTLEKVNEERNRKQELEKKISLLERDATAEIRRLYRTLVSSIKQSSAYKEAYARAEKSYQLQLSDYRFGLVNNLDVIQAMTAMSEAKKNLDRIMIQIKIDKALLDISIMQ